LESPWLQPGEDVKDLGYSIDVKVLSAHHYGVPQMRRRTIFLGNRFGLSNLYPEPMFKEPGEAIAQDLPLPRTVGWAFENLCEANGTAFNHDPHTAQIKSELERQRIKFIPEGKSIRYEKDAIAYLPSYLWFEAFSYQRKSSFG
jgi:DNA (cytosine-5)-methyltransferase 1